MVEIYNVEAEGALLLGGVADVIAATERGDRAQLQRNHVHDESHLSLSLSSSSSGVVTSWLSFQSPATVTNDMSG